MPWVKLHRFLVGREELQAVLVWLRRKKHRTMERRRQKNQQFDGICLDEAIRETILATYTYHDPSSPYNGSTEAADLGELASLFST
mmetsp:Transcript_21368/g.31506  ORF Transcript_21368/g.31506 Transcript_21368/m.31506 type:complete len:86 (-) Transcript_21368:1768-2025(-)